jgi:D-3-phosphoglycerate dehydrogenase
MKHVLVIEPFHDAGLALFAPRKDINLTIVSGLDDPAFLPALQRAEALTIRMAPLGAELIAKAPNLQMVSRHGVGYDTVDVDALTKRGIVLSVVGDVNSTAVSEQVMAFFMSLARQVPRLDRAVREGHFNIRHEGLTVEMTGKTVLIVGFGRIGRGVARRSAAFDMRVLVHDPFLSADAIRQAGGEAAPDLHAALAQADFITLHAPLTDKTRGMIGPREFGLMKRSAYLVNTARGNLVHQAALIEALKTHRIAGAGLDVYERHPPRADDPVLALDNVIFSPHSSGLTRECAERMGLACAGNVLAFFDGTLDPALVVNKK